MALVCEQIGLMGELKAFAAAGKPIWGTCAGMIFLSDGIGAGSKTGGQALLGGLPVSVSRNFFGAQINSFEADIPAPAVLPGADQGPCRSIFIRAPAILEAAPEVDVLATYVLTEKERAKSGRESVIVAVRKGNLLATAFHPELTDDTRWHQLFAGMVRAAAGGEEMKPFAAKKYLLRNTEAYKPGFVPIYGTENPFLKIWGKQ